MPQLEPAPWLFVLALSWAIFLVILIPKTLALTTPNSPSPGPSQKLVAEPWGWE